MERKPLLSKDAQCGSGEYFDVSTAGFKNSSLERKQYRPADLVWIAAVIAAMVETFALAVRYKAPDHVELNTPQDSVGLAKNTYEIAEEDPELCPILQSPATTLARLVGN